MAWEGEGTQCSVADMQLLPPWPEWREASRGCSASAANQTAELTLQSDARHWSPKFTQTDNSEASFSITLWDILSTASKEAVEDSVKFTI